MTIRSWDNYTIPQMTTTVDKSLQPKKVDASKVILGFTGPIGSGCTYISEMIPEVTKKIYKYYRLSSVIRDMLKDEGYNDPSIEQLQNKGNELRKANGNGFLIRALLHKIDEEWTAEYYGIVIDGIKNEDEVNVLRQWPNFLLFSVQAERELRCSRLTKDGKMTKGAFWEADRRDEREEFAFGQQVKRCNYLSDVIIMNDKEIAAASKSERMDFVQGIYEKYIRLVENLRDGMVSPEVSPDISELCMTIAYALSKSSSCLKRKVGALIVDVDQVANGTEYSGTKHLEMPNIVSCGYNEVPLGSYKCVFHPEYQMCCRDYLQEQYAGKLKHCPNCGQKIELSDVCSNPACKKEYTRFIKTCRGCGKEVESRYECPKCKTSVFDTYIPGSRESPGKLLDMCRALHAEEITLLNLGKHSRKSSDNLILYITTQPCNLCSNKIVAAGIKKVVFDEPYPMREALDILASGKVQLQRFQGIKSTAYFRLYR